MLPGEENRPLPPGGSVASLHPQKPRHHPLQGLRASGDLWPIVGTSAVVLAVIAFFWYFATGVSADIWVSTLVFFSLFAISVPVIVRLSRGPGGRMDPRLRKILLIAFCLKMLFVFPRYYVSEYMYGGETDAGQYHEAGRVFYDNVKHGDWSLDGSQIQSFPQETQIVGYYAGITYLAFGTTYMGSYMVFNWLAFIGLLLVFQGFRSAFPNAPPYRAAYLIFFLPSLLYWPSSLGKDAVMLFAIGILTYGVARLVTPNRPWWGAVCAITGGYLMTLVRPHLLAIALVGVGASLLAKRAPGRSTRAAVAVRLGLVALMVPGLFLALGRIDQAFGDGSDTAIGATVSDTLATTADRTSIGGSSFATTPVDSPLDLPEATVSVIFRPFLWEAESVPVLVSAIEGSMLLLLAIASLTWLWRIAPASYHHPFVAFCAGYCVAFIIAFSNIGNAGILARQRVQMFPLLMVIVAAAWEQTRQVRVDRTSPGVTPSHSPISLPIATSTTPHNS